MAFSGVLAGLIFFQVDDTFVGIQDRLKYYVYNYEVNATNL